MVAYCILLLRFTRCRNQGALLLPDISRDIHLVDPCSDLCSIWDTFVSDTLFLPDCWAYFSTPSLPLKQLSLSQNNCVLIEMKSKCKAGPVAGQWHSLGLPIFELGRLKVTVPLHTMSESPHQQPINYTFTRHFFSWYTHYLTQIRYLFSLCPPIFDLFLFLAKLWKYRSDRLKWHCTV